MALESPVLPPTERPIHSLVAQAQGHAPEVRTFPCVDPVETAVHKLSALAWRVCVRDRSSEKDDPTIIVNVRSLPATRALVDAYSETSARVARRESMPRGQ